MTRADRKSRLICRGMGVRGDVEVFGGTAHQQVPHGPADNVGVKMGASQPLDHPHGVRIHEAHVDPVLLLGVDVSLFLDVSVSAAPYLKSNL